MLELTASGQQMARKLQRSAERVRDAQIAGMTDQEVETLRTLLLRVISNLEELDASTAGKA